MKQTLLAACSRLCLIVACLLPLLSQAQTACTPLSGLLLQYAFDESQGAPQDATGQVGVGTLRGGALQPTGGHDGSGALALSGSDYLTIPLAQTPAAFTFSFWLKPINLFNWSQMTGAAVGWNGFVFHSTQTGGLYVGTTVSTRIELPNTPAVQAGVWQQFTFTLDNAGTGTIYKNGQLLATRAGMTPPAAWQGVKLGASSDAWYDDLRVYNRALSFQEVQSLYSCPASVTYLPPSAPSLNADRNWTFERSYDGNGNIIAESKQFTDALGRPTQAQARNAATKQVFAAQTVYSTGGQPVLQTLAAPTNNQNFSYKDNFITSSGAAYSPANFEQNKASAPDAVDATTPGTLGYYFSKQNAQEPLTPLTGFPFSLAEMYDGPMGGTKRAAAPGDELRMGKGREAKGRDFLVRREFDQYLALRAQFVPGSPAGSLQYQAVKSVSINADGRESIAVLNKDGQTLVTCLSGPQYPALPVYGFISADGPGNGLDNDAPAHADVHIPAAGAQDIKFTMSKNAPADQNGVAGTVRIVNLLTNEVNDYNLLATNVGVTEPEKHVTLAPGFYRFVSLRGTQWSYYEARYGNFSYTYYDDAGRVVATVAPNGLSGAINYLRNPGLEQDQTGSTTISGWQNSNSSGVYTQVGTGSNPAAHGGQLYGVHWAPSGHNVYTYQVLTGLPNGLYTARAWVKNTGIQQNWPQQTASLLAKDYDSNGNQRGADIPITGANGAWQQVQVTNIPVANGRCTLGLYSISQKDDWIIFDDVELVRQADNSAPTFVTRNTYGTSGQLLATESNDEGRSEYVYAQDGRIRFSQSALQRTKGRFSYSNYDEVGRVVESGEYTPAASGTAGVEFESHSTHAAKQVGESLLLEAEQARFQDSQANRPYAISAASNGYEIAYLQVPGNFIEFSAPVAAGLDGTYELQLRYSNGMGNARTMTVSVNGGQAQRVTFPATAGWETFATVRVSAALLGGTTNTIRLDYTSTDNGNINVDYLRVTPPLLQEAEEAVFMDSNASLPTNSVGASGGRLVGYLTSVGNYVEFRVTPPAGQSGLYELQFGYATAVTNARTISLRVNGNSVRQLSFLPTGGWEAISTLHTTATLQGGTTNVVRLELTGSDNGYINLDYLRATSQAVPLAHDQSVYELLENRTRAGGLEASQCAQRNQVWYDLAFDGTPGSQGNDSQLGGRQQQFLVGAVAKTKNDNVTTWYSYDELGRVTWVVQDIAGVGIKMLDYQYDFSGNVLQVAYQQNQPDRFYHYYTYDTAQRLTKVETSPDGTTRTLQAEYSYYLHGPLKRVQVAGNLQGVDYVYTLQGALKSINHATSALEPGRDAPKTNGVYKDLFALTLEYFSGDYRSRNIDVAAPVAPGASVPDRFDGTIRSLTWRSGVKADLQRQGFTYDEKSQLQNSVYNNWQYSKTTGAFQLNSASVNALREGGLSYDPNGNIQSLRRTNQTGAVTDNFSYVYKPNTNQLAEVHTGSPSGSTVLDYDYDELGQLTRQRDEQGQRYFTYDVTGKTTGVYLDAARQQPVVTFAYDDRGFRVSKTAYSGGTATQITYYVRDVAGNIMAVYSKPSPTGALQRAEVPLYGASRLGTLTRVDNGTANGTDDYRYELNDHLGNARVVFHRPTTTTWLATMETANKTQEEQDFTNVATTRYVSPGVGYGSDAVARLGLTNGQKVGPSKTLTVQKGDTITFSAYAYLTAAVAQPGGPHTAQALRVTPLVGAAVLATAATPASATMETMRPAQRPSLLTRLSAGLGVLIGSKQTAANPTPQAITGSSGSAYLHFVIKDEQGTLVRDDYRELNGSTPGTWQPLQVGLRLEQGGTVALSVESDGATGPDVYFDNVRVEQTGGLIVQEQHQYAFGAPQPGLSYTVGGVKKYRYGYQGQFAEKDEETGLENFELRLYNNRVGRWLSYDPNSQYNSPYVGMGNNPVLNVDPDGGLDGPWGIAAKLHQLGNVAVTAKRGLSTWARIGIQVGASALRTTSSYLEKGDAWVHSDAGEDFARRAAEFNPLVTASNLVSSATTGSNIFGEKTGGGDIAWDVVELVPTEKILAYGGKFAIGVAKPLIASSPVLLTVVAKVARTGTRVHHLASNKSKVFTKQFEKIAAQFGLKLNQNWNKLVVPYEYHYSNHPQQYHQFVLRGMERAANTANGDVKEFIRLFHEYVADPLVQKLDMLNKTGW